VTAVSFGASTEDNAKVSRGPELESRIASAD
jgi:hypothetical protein